MIEVRVGKDGHVHGTKVVKSISLLDGAAMDAVRQWTFRPATDHGNPVALWIPVSIAFPPPAFVPGGPGGRGGFGFVFETGNGERVDTFRELVTKDLVGNPDTTIALALTPAELDSIYRKVLEVHLLELPDLCAPTGCGAIPNTSLRLLVRAGGKERQFDWWSWWACSDSVRDSETYKGLYKVIRLIRRIVEARPEYKALPPPRGYYE
jgi:TonB family protein